MYLSYLVRGLRAKDHEIHTLTGPPPRGTIQIRDESFHVMPTTNVEAFRFVNFELRINHRLKLLQRRERFDLIQYNLPTYFGFPLFHSRSLPLFVTAHGCIGAMVRDFLHYRPVGLDLPDLVYLGGGPLVPRMERWAFSQANRVVAVCDWVKRALITLYDLPEERVRVVHNGIDTERFHPIGNARERIAHFLGRENLERPLILFMGRIMGAKDPATLARAIPLVLQTHPDAFFLIRGEGVTLQTYLKAMLKKVAPEGSYRFMDFVGGDELPAIYSAASVYVLPSIHEPFAYTLLEALACEAPAVATAVGGLPEIITNGQNGLLVEPSNPGLLAESISQLLDDEKLARRLGRAGRRTIETKFDLERFTEGFDSEIREFAG